MKSLDVSNLILACFDYKGDLITNKKLQKLLYYTEAWGQVYGMPFFDEPIEAWVHGPVIPNVYSEFKKFGYSPIVSQYEKNETSSTKIALLQKSIGINIDQYDLLKSVLQNYGSLSSYQLETLSHSEDPWRLTRGEIDSFAHSTREIDRALMKSYYSSLLNE